MAEAARTFGEVVAANIVRLRGTQSQQSLADDMTHIGFAWSRATVAHVETCRRQVTAEEIFGLCGLFTRLPGDFVATEAATVAVGSQDWPTEVLQKLGGIGDRDYYPMDIPGHPLHRVDMSAVRAGIQGIANTRRRFPEIQSDAEMDRARDEAKDPSVRNAARRLRKMTGVNVSPFDVSAASLVLWCRPFVVERDRRAKRRRSPKGAAPHVMRGHVTRQMTDELKTFIRSRRWRKTAGPPVLELTGEDVGKSSERRTRKGNQ